MTSITTQPDYPTWFKNPLNTRVRIGQDYRALSDESYWYAKALSKDHVLVEMHFVMDLELFKSNDNVVYALSVLFHYEYSNIVEDIIKGERGTRDSFIKNQEDKRKVLLLTPLGVCSPSVFYNNNGDLTATWKAIVLVTDSESHEKLKCIVDAIDSSGCGAPKTFAYTTRVWRSEEAWWNKVSSTYGSKYLNYLNIHTNGGYSNYLSWLDFKWKISDGTMFSPNDTNCTKWLTQSIIDLRDKAKNEQEQVGHQS